MIPDAALAVIAAAHEDARRAHGSTRYAAQLAARALAAAGWHIAPVAPPTGRQAGAQRVA